MFIRNEQRRKANSLTGNTREAARATDRGGCFLPTVRSYRVRPGCSRKDACVKQSLFYVMLLDPDEVIKGGLSNLLKAGEKRKGGEGKKGGGRESCISGIASSKENQSLKQRTP